MTHTTLHVLPARRIHHDPVEILARKMALKWINENRRAASMPPTYYVTKMWWDIHGHTWMRKAKDKLAKRQLRED
jgi:hypothetical protein